MSKAIERRSEKRGGEEKRRAILRAAVKVFAERGYHGCRIADVAREAGVAYGLVYHYFENKEALLTSVFEESWTLFGEVVATVAESDAPLGEKVRQIVSVALDAYRAHPHATQVMVLEIARSPFFLEERRLAQFEDTFRRTAAMIEVAQARGEARRDVDPMHGAYVIFGTIEMLLTGFVLHTLDAGDEGAFDAAKEDAIRIIVRGLAP
ncbi:MAG: TetR family transcriptional regulator [Deltaproteobacteria bacterium]|nr:MAG: TetR family transcriptional regulator [Deltaproteobacteria bacterium]